MSMFSKLWSMHKISNDDEKHERAFRMNAKQNELPRTPFLIPYAHLHNNAILPFLFMLAQAQTIFMY